MVCAVRGSKGRPRGPGQIHDRGEVEGHDVGECPIGLLQPRVNRAALDEFHRDKHADVVGGRIVEDDSSPSA